MHNLTKNIKKNDKRNENKSCVSQEHNNTNPKSKKNYKKFEAKSVLPKGVIEKRSKKKLSYGLDTNFNESEKNISKSDRILNYQDKKNSEITNLHFSANKNVNLNSNFTRKCPSSLVYNNFCLKKENTQQAIFEVDEQNSSSSSIT